MKSIMVLRAAEIHNKGQSYEAAQNSDDNDSSISDDHFFELRSCI